jgi:hypothetical protein
MGSAHPQCRNKTPLSIIFNLRSFSQAGQSRVRVKSPAPFPFNKLPAAGSFRKTAFGRLPTSYLSEGEGGICKLLI